MQDIYKKPYAKIKVKIKINGKTYTKNTDKNGNIKLKVSLLPKTYAMSVKSDGDNFHSKISQSVKIKVRKLTAKLTASDKKFNSNAKTKKYSVSLRNTNKKPLAKVKLTLKIKGKTFTAKTNSKGKATFKITGLTQKRTSKAVVKYSGSKYYGKVSKTVKISLK